MVSCVSNPTYVEQEGATLKTIRVKVKANEWSYTQQGTTDQFNNNYFYAGFNVPEINKEVFDYGEVKAYAVFDRQYASKARKHLLPYFFFFYFFSFFFYYFFFFNYNISK